MNHFKSYVGLYPKCESQYLQVNHIYVLYTMLKSGQVHFAITVVWPEKHFRSVMLVFRKQPSQRVVWRAKMFPDGWRLDCPWNIRALGVEYYRWCLTKTVYTIIPNFCSHQLCIAKVKTALICLCHINDIEHLSIFFAKGSFVKIFL